MSGKDSANICTKRTDRVPTEELAMGPHAQTIPSLLIGIDPESRAE